MSSLSRTILLASLVACSGCDFAARIHSAPATAAKPVPPPRPTAVASSPADPLGARPTLGEAKPFTPAAPVEFTAANGVHVWLVERPELPLVSASLVVPTGVANDPTDEPGLAQLTADMMDEGAGKRGAIELSTAVADLGASLSVSSNLDGTFASVSSLKQHFGEAFAILSDVVARPHLEAGDFKRVAGLWKNALKKRSDDPSSVANLVAWSALYGRETPYGHPALGLLSKADAITLADVKKFYQAEWRPDRATLVIVGQITKAEVEDLLKKNLGDWKGQGEASAQVTPTPPIAADKRPRLVLVDRPGAVQSVIVVARDGSSAGASDRPPLDLLNTALGGSFTSRLNENLREDKGWTYGAGSSFANARGEAPFVVRTSVEAPYTGPAIGEIVKEMSKMATDGLSDVELSKVKAQDRADLVELYETVGGTSSRLASLVPLALPASFDAHATEKRQSSTLDTLRDLAKAHLDPSVATIVVVGDAKTVTPQLASAGLPAPALWTTEGVPADTSTAPKPAAAKPAPEKSKPAPQPAQPKPAQH